MANPRFALGLDDSDRKVAYLLVLFLFIAAAIGDALFHVSEPFADLVTILALAPFAWILRPLEKAPQHPRELLRPRVYLMVLFLAAATAIRLLDGSVEPLVFALFLCGLDLLHLPGAAVRQDLPAMQLTLLSYTAFLVLQDHASYVSAGLAVVAQLYSRAASLFVRGDVSIGQGYLGLQLVVLFLLYTLSVAVFAQTRSAFRLLTTAAAVLLCGLAYAIGWGWLAGNQSVTHVAALLEPAATAYDYRLLLFALLVLPVVAYRLASPPRDSGATGNRRAFVVAAVLASILGTASLLLVMQPASGDKVERVVVLDSAGNMATDLPTFGALGMAKSGQFGVLPTYLEQSGYDVTVVKEVTPDLLEQTGTLVMINLRKDFTEETSQAIWEFVDAGGSLLVLGDHTGTTEIRDPSNKLLEPVGISLNFDSAIPVRDGWPNGYDLKPHPISNGITDAEVKVMIGASLQVSPPARPVLVGRSGYSDAGDMKQGANGFLGDMAFNPGEQMGDVILAAEATYGRGKVLVFGDTTLMQNGALAESYRFVDNIFAWLAVRSNAALWAVVSGVAAVVLVVGVGLVAFFRPELGVWITALPIAVLAVVLGVSGLTARPAQHDWNKREADPRAVIDVSHYELGRLDRSSDGLQGLVVNFVRNGYAPFVMREFSSEMIEGAEVLVLPAPMKPFTAAETDAMDAFVEGGGLLVLTAGSERPSGPHALLEHFGFSLQSVPLGRVDTQSDSWKASLWGAWPLEQSVGSGAEVIGMAWDYPVMWYREKGAGGVLVVADSSFLMNKNLEDVDTFSEKNILFLRDFLATYGAGGEGDS